MNIKTWIKSALMLVSLAVSVNSHALEYRFKTKIVSSGSNMWACNAGVASAIKNDKICYFGGNPKKGICTPNGCSDKAVCNTDCLCTSLAGMRYINMLNFSSTPVDAYGTKTTANASSTSRFYATGDVFRSVHPESQGFSNYIENLQAVFASEAYTGAYFFDICYLAPQIAEFKGSYRVASEHSAVAFDVMDSSKLIGLDNSRANLNMTPADSASYLVKAQSTIEKFVVCSTDIKTKAEFRLDDKGVPTGAAVGSIYKHVSAVSLTGDFKNDDLGSVHGAYNCKVRYLVRESNWASVLPIKRDTKPQGVEICTKTTFVDPPEGVSVNLN